MKHKKSGKARRLSRKDALRIWKGESRDSRKRSLYFGYGSNLDIGQMKRRCPDSVPMVPVVLPQKLLSFSNVLTIEDHDEEQVVGGIYEVSVADERALDRYEGHPRTYSKRYTFMTLDGERREVFYYVLNKPYTWDTPTARYYAIVEKGYKEWGLDLTILEASYQRARDAEKAARKAYWASHPKRAYAGSEDYQPMWAQSPDSSYTVAADGTIDYLDFAQGTLDKEWDDAMVRDMEESFNNDYRRYRGW